jgi:hypothetical protein
VHWLAILSSCFNFSETFEEDQETCIDGLIIDVESSVSVNDQIYLTRDNTV